MGDLGVVAVDFCSGIMVIVPRLSELAIFLQADGDMHLLIGILTGLALHLATTADALPHSGFGRVSTEHGVVLCDID